MMKHHLMDQGHLPALLLLRVVNQYHLEAHIQELRQVVDLEHLQAQNQELIQVENQNHLNHQKRIVQKVAEDVDKIRDLSLEVQRGEKTLPDFHQKVGDLLSKTKV